MSYVKILSAWGSRLEAFLTAYAKRNAPLREVMEIRKFFPEYRVEDLSNDYRQVRVSLGDWRGLKYIRYDYRIPEGWHLGVTWRMKTVYAYRAEFWLQNLDTGEVMKRWHTVVSDRPLSREEISNTIIRDWSMGTPGRPQSERWRPLTDERGHVAVEQYRAYRRVSV